MKFFSKCKCTSTSIEEKSGCYRRPIPNIWHFEWNIVWTTEITYCTSNSMAFILFIAPLPRIDTVSALLSQSYLDIRSPFAFQLRVHSKHDLTSIEPKAICESNCITISECSFVVRCVCVYELCHTLAIIYENLICSVTMYRRKRFNWTFRFSTPHNIQFFFLTSSPHTTIPHSRLRPTAHLCGVPTKATFCHILFQY